MMSGVKYREVVIGGQASVSLFYFNIVITCFCIVFYKYFTIIVRDYRHFPYVLLFFLKFFMRFVGCGLFYSGVFRDYLPFLGARMAIIVGSWGESCSKRYS